MTQDWQSAIDSSLVRRLMRPWVQPGAIGSQLGDSIVARMEQMTGHLPLLVQFAQRQAGVFQPEQIPIVYVQPSSSTEVVHSHTETKTEPLTIVQASLISNSTNLSTQECIQNVNHYTSNTTNLSIQDARQKPEFLMQTRSTDTIASSANFSLQNQPIVYAKTVESQSDRSYQTPIVRPLSVSNPKRQSPPTLKDSQEKSLPQIPPTRPKQPDSSSTSPIVTVRTGTEAAPATTWQNRTHLNEAATTIPIVFHQPNFHQPNFHQPNFHQPNFHQPNFHQPNFHQPNFHQPNFHQPNFHQPNSASSQSTSRTFPEHSQLSEFPIAASPAPPPINLENLTTQVERKILRRLVVESERRGQTRWR